MVSVVLHASQESPIAGWLRAAGFMVARDEAEAAAVIFTPEHASAGPQALPRIACLPLDLELAGDWLVAPGAIDCARVRADAYAGDEVALRAALQYVLRERPEERTSGPLRLIWLGSLGELQPAQSPQLGASVLLAGRVLIGRSSDSHLCLRHGAHSDQNTVARRHVIVEPSAAGALVQDCQSTNGTWLRGQRIVTAELLPGEEMAIAGMHRIRLDGRP